MDAWIWPQTDVLDEGFINVAVEQASGSLWTEGHGRTAGQCPTSDKLHSSVTSHHYAIPLLHCTAQHHHQGAPAPTQQIQSSQIDFINKHEFLIFFFIIIFGTFFFFCLFFVLFFALTMCVTDKRPFVFEEAESLPNQRCLSQLMTSYICCILITSIRIKLT